MQTLGIKCMKLFNQWVDMFKDHLSKAVAAIFVIVVCVGLGSAQAKSVANGWESKPVDQWTDSDIREIFHHSAWSQSLQGGTAENVAGTILKESETENKVYAIFSLES